MDAVGSRQPLVACSRRRRLSEHAPLQRQGTWNVAAASCAADEGSMQPGRLQEPSSTVYAASKLSAAESVQPGSRRPHPPESAVAEGS